MRLWSLHPSYLDSKGLVALWREALLARHVLLGKTKGYRHHPQLIRFQLHKKPTDAIESYLWDVYEEAVQRGYQFDRNKLSKKPKVRKISVTTGQIEYEWKHLLQKLKKRDPQREKEIKSIKTPLVHPLFQVIEGTVETWEKI